MGFYLLSYNRKSYLPQMSCSHMYLVAETTLYIVHLRTVCLTSPAELLFVLSEYFEPGVEGFDGIFVEKNGG